LVESYGKLPLSFEINKGQTDSQVKFLSRGSGYSLFLTGNEAVLALKQRSGVRSQKSGRPLSIASRQLQPSTDLFPPLLAPSFGSAPSLGHATGNRQLTTDAVLHMKLLGANPKARVSGLEELPGKSNYFIGNDPKKWRTNVPNYAKVKYANVYPGVDLVYYGNQGKLEYDFVVQPGADPGSIQLAVVSDEGGVSRQKAVGSEAEQRESQSAIANRQSSMAAPLRVDAKGDLAVGTEGGEVIFRRPLVYQPAAYDEPKTKNQELVESKYVVQGNRITFEVASYDKTKPLVIDPVLAYSTYLGGSAMAAPP
jgi:hypothetical protein